jgi:hypothetical protein
MMIQIVPYVLVALVCTTFVPASYASGVGESKELTNLVSQSCDPHMMPKDLAFFLATYNFDATPKDGYVQVKIDGTI